VLLALVVEVRLTTQLMVVRLTVALVAQGEVDLVVITMQVVPVTPE
jgi:hypothetical protein